MIIQKVIYFHRDKETNFDIQEELGMNDKAMETFMYTGSEIGVLIEVNKETGEAWATHLEGVELKEPVRI